MGFKGGIKLQKYNTENTKSKNEEECMRKSIVSATDLVNMAEILEDMTIIKMIEERDKNDDGTRYTSEDVIRMRKIKDI